MSKIIIETVDREIKTYGRSQMTVAINENLFRSLKMPEDNSSPLAEPWREIVPPDCSRRIFASDKHLKKNLEMWLVGMIEDDAHLTIGDIKVDCFSVALNTALKSAEPLKFAARIHGQCELNCFVEGKNRPWLAEQISKERIWHKYYPPEVDESGHERWEGWEKAIAFIRESQDESIVFSFGVCEPFLEKNQPSSHTDDDWDDLPQSDRWRLGMEVLRERATRERLELSPDNWDNFYFKHGWDADKINYLLTLETSKRLVVSKIYNETRLRAPEAWEIAKNAIS